MNEEEPIELEEKKAIELVKIITYVNGIRNDTKGEEEDYWALDTILKLVEKQQKELEILKSKIDAKEKVHEYDMQMIDEVKGQVVKLQKEIEELKEYKYMYEDLCK